MFRNILPLEEDPEIIQLKDLNYEQVQKKIAQYGYNEIQVEYSHKILSILSRLWGPIPWMLEIALIFEIFLGKTIDSLIITGLLILSAIIGGTEEVKAKVAVDFLRRNFRVTSRVRRNNKWQFISARELVPGDLVHVKLGDIVPADCLINYGSIEVDQSTLTGESTFISILPGNSFYSGSIVVFGEAIGTVIATGVNSLYGKTTELVKTAESPGHLHKLIFRIIRYLTVIDSIVAIIFVAIALWNHTPLIPLLPFLVIFFLATIPISMPASFTLANAVEARRLAKKGILVTELSAIQDAANMEVLCVDKTGTLTQNKPEISAIISFSEESEDKILAYAAAACDEAIQNPINIAIINEFNKRSIQLLNRQKLVPFDPATKYSEAYVNIDGQIIQIILGSPTVIEQFVKIQDNFKQLIEKQSSNGARVLAVATGINGKFVLQGIIVMNDMPRPDAALLVQAIHDLGVRILMVTGDTSIAAQAICKKVNIGDRIGTLDEAFKEPLRYDGFANIYPEEKYRIVKALQKNGLTIGMTGDGINDAPALKQAEVGITVNSASDVAKISSKVVLTNPGLQDIVKVIIAGRRVYRRMLTWTITKITRTLEFLTILTIGYIATGCFVIPLSLIIVITVMNDLVTLNLGMDNAWVSQIPEQWDILKIIKLSGVITIGWLIIIFIILWLFFDILNLPTDQIPTIIFLCLIFTAQATIYITRVQDYFWTFKSSWAVIAITFSNIVIASILAINGILMPKISVVFVLALLVIITISTFLLDMLKVWFYKTQKY